MRIGPPRPGSAACGQSSKADEISSSQISFPFASTILAVPMHEDHRFGSDENFSRRPAPPCFAKPMSQLSQRDGAVSIEPKYRSIRWFNRGSRGVGQVLVSAKHPLSLRFAATWTMVLANRMAPDSTVLTGRSVRIRRRGPLRSNRAGYCTVDERIVSQLRSFDPTGASFLSCPTHETTIGRPHSMHRGARGRLAEASPSASEGHSVTSRFILMRPEMRIVKLLNERIGRYFRPMDLHLVLCSNSIVQNGHSFRVSCCEPGQIGSAVRN